LKQPNRSIGGVASFHGENYSFAIGTNSPS
jgi:hypothetical protein